MPAAREFQTMPWGGPKIPYGGDYNPDQWPESVWAEDARLMRAAGVNFASVGIFSWAKLEPSPGEYDTDWLARVMDLLHEAGVTVDLATATAAPPAWFSTAYPQSRPVDERGTRYAIGSRQTWCASSPEFRERALALVQVLAERFGAHPALGMWHVNNELGCHNSRCYCEVSTAHFRRWLQARYADLDRLNDAWGTAFWSQHYSDWDQVSAPSVSTAQSNPTQLLDFARFSSDALLEHFCAERDLLHQLTPGIPVTTNFMSMDATVNMDYFAWGVEQDVVSTDHYITGRMADPYAELAFNADATRGMAGGDPWLLMEHSSSAVNWQPVNLAKAPGEMRRTSLAHVARGADAVAYFQWRQSAAGAEKYHSALLPHAGTESRQWRESVELGQILGRMADLRGSTVDAEVAILEDWPSRWAAGAHSMPSDQLDPRRVARDWHRQLRRAGVTADVVGVETDLTGYRVVIVPALYMCSDATADAIAAAARGGAQVVITCFSGIVDTDDRVRLGGYPGAFAQLLGIRIEEFAPLLEGDSVALDSGATGSLWTERGAAVDAKVLASYADGPSAGSPALTVREVGEGAAWYVGTCLDPHSLGALLDQVLNAAEVRPAAEFTAARYADVDNVRRTSETGSWLFVLNHGADPVTVQAAGHDLVEDRQISASTQIGPGNVVVIREAN